MLQPAGWPLLGLIVISFALAAFGQTIIGSDDVSADLSTNLQVQSLLRQLRRVKRAPPRKPDYGVRE
ncbi:unnamed protein product [Anisakis simplex]|uniref:Conotoxin n=1 Tax=Anisakis simplex TaxID=6269 RepID=A0A0M3JYF0_ANISI|nr:unnamed protein product [Anisakis simplex]